jgi:chitinase
MGCGDLLAGEYICLSSGYPPMPAPVANAVCGPQVPGTVDTPNGFNISLLNQCPLNACCDKWGQCGTTAEFCTISESPTGAPGTSANGTNGCISNCGTDIIVGSGPSEYLNIGFFEGFNMDRPCLNAPVTALDLTPYTHVVMSFAAITSDYDIDITPIQESFDEFVAMTGNFKKIISIGGWAFSTDPSTYMYFREAVQPANMVTFASNIVAFLATYGLDGVNLDW